LKRADSVSITRARRIGCARAITTRTPTATTAENTRRIPTIQRHLRVRRSGCIKKDPPAKRSWLIDRQTSAILITNLDTYESGLSCSNVAGLKPASVGNARVLAVFDVATAAPARLALLTIL
jgi:hypothetical protein